MRWKWLILPAVFLFIVGAALPARSQVTYAAQEGKLPFTVGVGFSNFSDDWGASNPRQSGVTLWIDWRIPHLPPKLDGLGLEVEGRDINFMTPSYIPGHRMDTGLGGPIWEWRRKGSIRPYGKFLAGIGSIDFPNNTFYQHDTRAVYEPGGGVNFRFWKQFSARGEYDYQFWHQLFGQHDLNPQGFSVGVVYDFGLRTNQ